jgi:hypothetical protein
MIPYLLVFAHVCTMHTSAVQHYLADMSFGHLQVEQVICDRPEMGSVINRNPALRELLESCFAGALLGERVYWDNREPLDKKRGGHFPSYRVFPPLVRVSNQSNSSAVDRCVILVIELQHCRFDNNHKALDLMAVNKQISRNDFARSCVRLEFQAAKRAQEFFRKHPLSEANSESDTYYTSVTKSFGEFSDYMRWQEGPVSKDDNLLQYHLDAYDELLSDSAYGRPVDFSVPMR